MYNDYKIKDVVKIVVDHPDGATTYVKGHVGVIVQMDLNGIYVSDGTDTYVFGEEQITLATVDEIKEKFFEIVISRTHEI